MFKIAKSTETDVAFRTDAGTAIIKMRFLWLPVSRRLEVMERHDAAIGQLPAPLPEAVESAPADPSSAMSAADRARALAKIHAQALINLADGWDLAYENGEPVPWEIDTVAEALDWMPGLWLHILTAAGKATSFEAVEGN